MAAADGMNQVTVLFFATLRDRAGSKSTTLQLPQGMLVKEFKHLLGQEIPSLAEHMHNALVAINHDYAFD